MSELDKVSLWVQRVKQAYLSDDQALTNSLMDQAMDDTNSAPRLLEVSGIIAYRSGNIEEAIRLIEAAMFEVGLSIAGQLTLANAWLRIGELESARTTAAFLVEVLDRVPCSMLTDLTHLLAALQEYELAIVVCRTAFERHDDDDNAVFGAAFYMYRSGYPLELVKSVMLKAVQMNPSSQLYLVNLAIICCALEAWNEAYSHACRLTDQSLNSVPCGCMVEKLSDLFTRFDDFARLEKLNSRK